MTQPIPQGEHTGKITGVDEKTGLATFEITEGEAKGQTIKLRVFDPKRVESADPNPADKADSLGHLRNVLDFRFKSFRVGYDQTPGWWYVLDENLDGKVQAYIRPVRDVNGNEVWRSDNTPDGMVFWTVREAVLFEFGLWLESGGWL